MASIECRNNTNGKIYRIRLPEGESVSRSRIRFGRITKQRRDLTPCFVNGCDNMRENANLDNLPLIPPRGIEPLAINSQPSVYKALTENENSVFAISFVNLLQKYPELQEVITTWPELPEHVKNTILSLVTKEKE